ncbi:allophanate hydrolase [Verminephrobacter aporrectodeae]|uniref:allophanate hydrolase n=1 Tax=Verminephrobacter aporrectodeae TaxID=1110389 RepID=UPI002242CA08|nr:allophanate hydrolase [Verminephrobacter aporrectodeae]MCW8175893.1 allophanate hydrolase [Verminephrobacter aporrectodeae subsp. tuberculatae]MCW8203592.1 allophanate hydrolase [Verminephrobacter aporrectodeae subsp. tuberculatae]
MVQDISREPSGPEGAPQAWIERFEQPLVACSSGSLSGLRFAVKDNIDVLGWPTTAACAEFAYRPRAHATVVQQLLDAGASLVGKTNLDQFACGLSGTRSPHGAVPNAFNADYVSGGSSSGSAYVVATGQVDFALGTDTAGSGRVPAGLNNIVGIKPSRGLLSTRGVLPAMRSVDCVSILARTVAMAARVLQVAQGAQGADAHDPYARTLQLSHTPFGSRFRFGLPEPLEFFGDRAAQAAFSEAVQRLTALGGVAVAIDYRPLAQAAALLYESALVTERYAALRAFFDSHEGQVIEPVRSIIAKGRSFSAADLCAAQTQLRACAQQAGAMWASIDVLLVPTAPTHYRIAAMQADPVALNRNLGYYTNFVNLLDYAAIAVPSSIRADGLPFGITLIGPCGSDWPLAELGQRYHHASKLLQGALQWPLPAPQALTGISPAAPQAPPPDSAPRMKIAVVGAHLSGMPLNAQLGARGARLLQATSTAPNYRLYALRGSTPPKPGLRRVPEGGSAIALEVWEMPQAQVGSFLALIAPPLGLGQVELADGSWVTGFICEGHALEAAQDITAHGGWRAYLAACEPA